MGIATRVFGFGVGGLALDALLFRRFGAGFAALSTAARFAADAFEFDAVAAVAVAAAP
jgi:hypothetical protein